MIYCARCGKPNEDNYNFCTSCGSALYKQKQSNTHLKKSYSTDAIILIGSNFSAVGKDKHEKNRYVISRYENSNNPLDILAVGLAYANEGAAFRVQAIQCFEKYFQNPIPIPKIPNRKPEAPYYSQWYLHSTLSSLYEKEYRFENAVEQLKICIKINKMNPNGSDYTRIAGIIVKQYGVDQALGYIENLMKEPVYTKIKHSVECCRKDLLEKKRTGYVYKSRKKVVS